jgi:uncharacterized damage-inducible protein DinB
MQFDAPSCKDFIFGDLERELKVTRSVLEQLPDEHFDWTPHEKSMSLGALAYHVAQMPEWMRATLAQNELDAANAPRAPQKLPRREELLALFDQQVIALHQSVDQFDVQHYHEPWMMRNGAQVIVTRPRSLVYRVWSLNHLIHHRAQLCVYLRLLNVPVPTVYFNTSDNPAFVFE